MKLMRFWWIACCACLAAGSMIRYGWYEIFMHAACFIFGWKILGPSLTWANGWLEAYRKNRPRP